MEQSGDQGGPVPSSTPDAPMAAAYRVVAVCTDELHRFSKVPREAVTLVAGLGVEGDTHLGATVQHRSRVRRDPSQPNLRQVHLVSAEFLDEAVQAGFDVSPGQLGENVLTRGLDLLALPTGAVLDLGSDARVRVTGLRNPCQQIDDFREGLLRLAVRRDEQGEPVRRAGVMAVVLVGGRVRPGDTIRVTPPVGPHRPLCPV